MEFLENLLSMGRTQGAPFIDSKVEDTLDSLNRYDAVIVKYNKSFPVDSTTGYFVRKSEEGLVLSRDRRTRGILFSAMNRLRTFTIPYKSIESIDITERFNPCEEPIEYYRMNSSGGCEDYDKQYLFKFD